MGGAKPYEIPDYRKYKVEGIRELEQLQAALAQKGLKDPWIRNEVWRYNPSWGGTHYQKLVQFAFRGFKYGFAAFVVTVAIESALNFNKKDHHTSHH